MYLYGVIFLNLHVLSEMFSLVPLLWHFGAVVKFLKLWDKHIFPRYRGEVLEITLSDYCVIIDVDIVIICEWQWKWSELPKLCRTVEEKWTSDYGQLSVNLKYSMTQGFVQPLNAAAWLQAQSDHLGYVVGKSGSGKGFCPAAIVFPCQCRPIGAPYLFVCHRPCMNIETDCALK